MEKQKSIGKFILYAFLIIYSAVLLLPIYWAFLTSIKISGEIYTYPPIFIPSKIHLMNYINAFTIQPMWRFFLNSIIIAGISTILAGIVAIFPAYAFSRMKFKGSKFLMGCILFPMLLPALTNIIPIYTVYSKMGLIDTYFGMILLYVPGLLPFSIIVLMSFFSGIPMAIEESAYMDGCSRTQVILSIIVPIAVPSVISISLINFVTRWNEFIMAVIFTSKSSMRTLPVGIYNIVGVEMTDFGALNAAAIGAILPPLILFIIFRNKFMSALIEGAVKG